MPPERLSNGWLSRARALRAAEWRIVVQAALLTPAFWVALRTVGASRMLRWLQDQPDRPRGQIVPREGDLAAGRIADLVNAAARLTIPGGNCLPRSMVLSCLLRRRGVPHRLCIGVQRHARALSAHAWVEADGRPLNDRPDIALLYPPLQPAGDVACASERRASR